MNFTVAGDGSISVAVDGRFIQVRQTDKIYPQVWDLLHDETITDEVAKSALKEWFKVKGCKQCGGNIYLKLNLELNGEAGFCLDCLAELVDIGLQAIRE